VIIGLSILWVLAVWLGNLPAHEFEVALAGDVLIGAPRAHALHAQSVRSQKHRAACAVAYVIVAETE
jgi:hypothetical protein